MATRVSSLAGDIPVLGPIGVAIATLGAASAAVLAGDAVRHGVIFHNPGSDTVWITPGNLAAAAGAGSIPVYPQTEVSIFEEDMLKVICAWNARTQSLSNQPLTILNFTDNNPAAPAPEAKASLNLDPGILSPVAIAVGNLGTVSQQVIGPNPVRRAIAFINAGTVPLYVCPANLTAIAGAGSVTVLPGQMKEMRARGRIRVNCGWNAIAASGSNRPLTILEYL